MIDPFQLTAMSNNGLLFLKLVLGMQDLWARYEKANKEQREEAAKLLRRIAACVKDIHQEILSDDPNPSKHVGSMRVYLKHFDVTFAPVLGKDEAVRLHNQLVSLFAESDTPDGPMISGFLALDPNKNNGSDKFSEHVRAAITTLVLVYEQLDATADVIEFGNPLGVEM
jgi:hypothetical protein